MKVKIRGIGLENLQIKAARAGLEISSLAALVHVSKSTLIKAITGEPIRPSSYVKIKTYFYGGNDWLDNFIAVVA